MAETPGLLFVHPHPDDESIACGGTIARYVDEGLRVRVVTCTGGEEGENLSGIDLGDEEMPRVRSRELADALALLNVTDHALLGYRDSGMAGAPSNDHPGSFHRAELDAAAGRLAAMIREFRPDVVVSDDERGTYGHPDHIKAHQVAVRAVEMAADASAPVDGAPWQVRKRYVVAFPRERLVEMHTRLLALGLASPFGDAPAPSSEEVPFGVPVADVTTRLDVTPWIARKRGAMAAHASQVGQDSFFLNIPDELWGEVFGTEWYVRAEGPGPTGSEQEDDLVAGLR